MRLALVPSGSGILSILSVFSILAAVASSAGCGGSNKPPRRDAAADASTVPVTVLPDGGTVRTDAPTAVADGAAAPKQDAPSNPTTTDGGAGGAGDAASNGSADAPVSGEQPDGAGPNNDARPADGAVATNDAGKRDSATAAGPDAGTSPFCVQLADRARRCNDTFNVEECADQEACFEGLLRPQVRGDIRSCLARLPCNQSEESCVVSAATPALLLNPVFLSFVQACQAKTTTCAQQMVPLNDDLCSPVAALLRDDVLKQVSDCYARPCAQIATCLTALEQTNRCR